MNEFEDAIKFGEPLVAYHALYCIQNPDKEVDWTEVYRMRNEDSLGIMNIKLFTAKQDKEFHLILASNAAEASKGIIQATGYTPFRVFEMPNGMDQPLWFENGNTKPFSQTVRQMKDSAMTFPHYIGSMEKEK